MKLLRILSILIIVLQLSVSTAFAWEEDSSGSVEVKSGPGVYIHPWNEKLRTEETTHELIEELRQHNITMIFVDVYSPKGAGKGVLRIKNKGSWHGMTDVPEFYNDMDLDVILEEAHAKNIEVHVLVCCFGGAGLDYPEYSVSPTSELHKNHLLEVIDYLIHAFPSLDGVQLDYIRYMKENGYKAEGDTDTIANFVRNIRMIVRDKKLSATVIPASYENPWFDWLLSWFGRASEYYEVWHDYGQDYTKMSQFLDIICPMAYHVSFHRQANWVGAVTTFVKQKAAETCVVVPIIQAFYQPDRKGPDILDEPGYPAVKDAIESARANNAYSISVYMYGTISADEWKAIDNGLKS